MVLPPAFAGLQQERQKAKQAWEEAETLRRELSASTDAGQDAFMKCIRKYRSVYLLDPRFFAADDAIFAAGELYLELAGQTGETRHLQAAAAQYRFLLTDYPTSRHRKEARRQLDNLTAQAATNAIPARTGVAAEVVPSAASVPPVQSSSAKAPAPAARSSSSGGASIRSIRFWSGPDSTRVSIDLDGSAPYAEGRVADPARLFIDFQDTVLAPGFGSKSIAVGDEYLQQVRVAQNQRNVLRVVLDLSGGRYCTVSRLEDPFRVLVEIRKDRVIAAATAATGRGAAARPEVQAAPAGKEAEKPAAKSGSRPPVGPAAVPALLTDSAPRSAAKEPERPVPAVKIPEPPAPEPVAVVATATFDKIEASLPIVPKSGTHLGPSFAAVNIKPVQSDILLPTVKNPESVVIPKPAAPTSRGDRTLTRVLGLKIGRIVIDPGHGAHDTGTVGRDGLMEKDLVLQVGRILRKMLEDNLGAEVFLTRDADEFISLEDRTAIANQHQADLFISIHANASRNKGTSGVETYFLDFARSPSEREVAARENAATIHAYRDLESLVQKIARADKMAESRELAATVQKNLYGSARQVFPSARNRGVRSAPFVVLIGAKMPSVLAEVAFLSNPRDEKLLKRDSTQQRLAKALFQGIEVYMKALGSEVAQSHFNGTR